VIPQRRIANLVGAGTLVTAAIVVAFQLFAAMHASKNSVGTLSGTPVVPERSAPVVTMRDQRDHPVALIAPGARATFVFFGYTHCKDTCPLALATLAKAYKTLPDPGRVRVEMVTVDPAHDDPAALRRFVGLFDPHLIGLTAAKPDLDRIWSTFGVVVDNRTREVAHGDGIYLVDAQRRILTIYPPDVTAADLAHDARIVANS
jgi:protein SCO1/2